MAATVLLTVLAGSAVLAGGKPQPPPPPPPAPEYALTALKPLPGCTDSAGEDVNDSGQVVGSSGGRAVLWPSATAAPIELPLDEGYAGSWAGAINNVGCIVGRAGWVVSGRNHPVIWVPVDGGYQMQDLTGYSADDGSATDINEGGYVTGLFLPNPDAGWPADRLGGVAFVIVPEDADGDGVVDTWFRDTDPGDGINDLMHPLDVFRDQVSFWWVWPTAINDSGWVVGMAEGDFFGNYLVAGTFLIVPDYGDPGNPWVNMGAPDANGCSTNDRATILAGNKGWDAFLNNDRQTDNGSRMVQVVGNTAALGDRAALFDVEVAGDGTVSFTSSVLPAATTRNWTFPLDINDSGLVVGHGYPTDVKRPKDTVEPLLWQPDKGTRALESLCDMAGFSDLGAATSINGVGQIVGTGTTGGGQRGYVATPK